MSLPKSSLLLVYLILLSPLLLGAGGMREGLPTLDHPTFEEQTPIDPSKAGEPEESLKSLITRSLRDSPQQSIRILEVQRQLALRNQARARKLPTMDFTSSMSFLSNPPEGITIAEGSLGTAPDPGGRFPLPFPNQDLVLVPDPEQTYFTLKPSLSLPLFTWGKLSLAIEAANLQLSLAQLDQDAARWELEKNIRTAWYGIALGKESLEMLDTGLELLQSMLQDAEQSFAQGIINREKVIEAESRLRALGSQRQRAQESIEEALWGLSLLTGLPLDTIQKLPITWEYASLGLQESMVAIKSPETFIGDDPQIQKARVQEALANTGLALTEASSPLRPNLALQAQLEITGQRIPGTLNWTDTWDANLIVSIGIQGGLLDIGASSGTQAALLQAQQARIGADLQTQARLMERNTLVQSFATLAKVREEKSSALALKTETLRNAQAAFENGFATRADLAGARLLELQSRLELNMATYALLEAQIKLDAMEGRSLIP